MKKSWATVLEFIFALQPVWVFGDSTVSPPNPVGEKVYREHMQSHLLAAAIVAGIIVGTFLVAWIISKTRCKEQKLIPEDAASHPS